MTSGEQPVADQVPPELGLVVDRSALPVYLVRLDTFVISAANQAVADLLGLPMEQIVGTPIASLVVDPLLTLRGLGMLASGMLDGYRAKRAFRTAAGDVVEQPIWVRSAVGTRPPTAIVVLGLDASSVEGPLVQSAGDAENVLVVGTVDKDWRVDRISNDVEALLHVSSAEVLNARLTEFVHPDDLSDLLTAVGRAVADRTGVCVRVRLRRDGEWLVSHLTVIAVEPQDRASFAFVVGPAASGDPKIPTESAAQTPEATSTAATPAARIAALERSLHRIAQEVHAAGLVERMNGVPAVASLPPLARLSSREWQVLSDLTEGRRVADIASALHLSQSTVRNHLSAIFKKLNVRSQHELLALLRQAPGDRTST